MEANQIVFMGGCFRDLVACSPRFPKVGETIVGSKFHMGFGGKAANAAVMCARLGGQVSIISKLGNDGNGVAYRDAFQTEGIDTLHLYTDPNEPSGVAQIMVDTTTGNNIIIVVPGSNATISIEEINLAERLISDAKFISFGLEGNHDAVIAALEIAKRNGVRTMTNAAPARHDLHPKIFELTDILCVNETEAQIIIGLEDPIESEEQIQNAMTDLLKKCHTVIITLGGKGAAIATREAPKASWVKAEKVDKVVDTTGAGDSFVGSMAFYMANFANLDLEEIVRRSCNIASISVTKEGTQMSFPNKSQLLPVEKFFQ